MSFKELSDKEHILLRPSMFIGSTSFTNQSYLIKGKLVNLNIVPGLLKIINEIIDNSVDEFIRTAGKHANKIVIEINKDFDGEYVSVTDNGRGIPVIKHPNGYQPVICWSKPRAGSNFDDARVTMGMNGYGSCLTNYFSKIFIGETSDGSNKLNYINENDVEKVSVVESKLRYTKVKFYPNYAHFETDSLTQDHITYLSDRIENLAISFPGIEFKLLIKNMTMVYKAKSPLELKKMYGDSAVVQKTDKMLLLIASSGDREEFSQLTYASGLHLSSGGSHIDYIISQLCDELKVLIKKKHKIEVLPNQIKQHIILVTYMSGFPDMKFESQTKNMLTNPRKDVASFLDIDFIKLAKDVLDNEHIITPMINSILLKQQQAELMRLAKAQKQLKRKNIPGYIHASGDDASIKRLFITEGESAMGPFISVRNPATDGGYPLKGKVLNALKAKPSEILANVEYSDLISILGLEIGKPVDFDQLKYKNIMIMTDADVDGQSIYCHLINFFSLWPELITNGVVKRVITPLFICRKIKNKKIISEKKYFSIDEYNEALSKKIIDKTWIIKYNKGLGSLDNIAYSDIVKNTEYETVVWTDDSREWLNIAFGNDADLRKSWLIG